MAPNIWEFLAQIALETLTLLVLITGLAGLLIPVFPGLTIMWLGTLVYAVVQAGNQSMTGWDWVLFSIITLLMIGGNILDNLIIAKHVRDKQVPWGSILFAFTAGLVVSLVFTPLVGMIAAPVGLFAAELRRLKDRTGALENTKAWMTGWGWAIAARLTIGFVILLVWGAWAWL